MGINIIEHNKKSFKFQQCKTKIELAKIRKQKQKIEVEEVQV